MSVFNYTQLGKPRDVYEFCESDEDVLSSDSEGASNSNEASLKSPSNASNSEIDFVGLDFEFFCRDKQKSKVLATVCDFNLYTKHGSCARGVRYRCKDRKCRAFLIFCEMKNVCMRLKKTPVHKDTRTDSSVETEYWNLVATNEMRRQCSNLATLAGGKRLASVRSIFSNVKEQ